MNDQELLDTPDSDLSAGLYYRKYKLEQKKNGSTGSGVNMVPADDLYELFYYYEKARKSPNQLVKHIRAEGTSCSNERAKELFPEFTKKYKEDKQDA